MVSGGRQCAGAGRCGRGHCSGVLLCENSGVTERIMQPRCDVASPCVLRWTGASKEKDGEASAGDEGCFSPGAGVARGLCRALGHGGVATLGGHAAFSMETRSTDAISRGRLVCINQSLDMIEKPFASAISIMPGQYSTGILLPIFHWPTRTAVQSLNLSETTLFPPSASMSAR